MLVGGLERLVAGARDRIPTSSADISRRKENLTLSVRVPHQAKHQRRPTGVRITSGYGSGAPI